MSFLVPYQMASVSFDFSDTLCPLPSSFSQYSGNNKEKLLKIYLLSSWRAIVNKDTIGDMLRGGIYIIFWLQLWTHNDRFWHLTSKAEEDGKLTCTVLALSMRPSVNVFVLNILDHVVSFITHNSIAQWVILASFSQKINHPWCMVVSGGIRTWIQGSLSPSPHFLSHDFCCGWGQMRYLPTKAVFF